MKNTGLLLLGVWLTALGLKDFFQLQFRYHEMLFAGLGFAAGVSLLLNAMGSKFASPGLFLLAAWLLLKNGMMLFNWNFPASAQILSIIGIVAGILLILKK